jgi:hypothetical protein
MYAERVNLIKIGISDFPEIRLDTIQNLSPVPLKILKVLSGGIELERKLHKKFQHLNSHGEWFFYENDIINYLKVVKDVREEN